MADDELAIPQVPEPKPDDPEDVSWALSTAEAMWARGDHLEGIKWVRKAAEAASESEQDMRALELAKVAADLAAMIARRSMSDPPASSRTLPGGGPGSAPAAPTTSRSAAPPVPAPPVPAPPAPAAPPAPSRTPPPAPVAPPAAKAASAPPAPKGRSIPPAPIPLPSKSTPPAAPSSASRAAPRPVATSVKPQGPATGKGVLSNRPPPAEKKGRRRSRDNLEAEARAAGVLDTAPQPIVDADSAQRVLGKTDEMPAAESARARRRSRPEQDPTVVAHMKDLIASKSADEWDNSPTQSLAGNEVPEEHERQTAVSKPPPRAPSIAPHDPQIHTTQAVRVVVFRDANGVHVAPAGTVVSAIKIDAVLVALDPNADLTAWLTQRDR
jgi:hypothetical protein